MANAVFANAMPLDCGSEMQGVESESPLIEVARLRVWKRVLWLRAQWANGQVEGEQGMAIPHSEVDRLLAAPAPQAAMEAAFYEHDPEAQGVSRDIERAESRLAQDAAWARLREVCGLSPPEGDLLLLAVAAEIAPPLRRAYGYLNDDVAACWPSPWLASALFEWPKGARIGTESALIRWMLATPLDTGALAWSQTAPWIPDPALILFLTGGNGRGGEIGSAGLCEARRDAPEAECFYPELRDAVVQFVQGVRRQTSAPIEIELIGPTGAGRETLAAQIADCLHSALLVGDAAILLGPDVAIGQARGNLLRAIRAARLHPGLLCWRDAEQAQPACRQSMPEGEDLTFYLGTAPLAARPGAGTMRRAFRLPRLTRPQRLSLWNRLTDAPLPAPVAEWTLTPQEISLAAQVSPAGRDAVLAVCRQQVSQMAGDLLAPLPCPYTWDDLVLPPGIRKHLSEFAAQSRLRDAVYDEWGLGKLTPLGRGISALFAGPSGTGKTMAAQVLARALDLELFRIDLSEVMNKYIGETEKRLKQVFDGCERANALLFFDEADALFGQRTQVKDAHDRFANIEINYLLQRLEQYDGIAILATNRKADIDSAFLRRLRFVLDFLPPGPGERLELWRRALPEHAPDGTALLGNLDRQWLADRLTMTGADIKNAALSAAFLARSEGAKIEMRHLFAACRRELAKHGIVARPGEWES